MENLAGPRQAQKLDHGRETTRPATARWLSQRPREPAAGGNLIAPMAPATSVVAPGVGRQVEVRSTPRRPSAPGSRQAVRSRHSPAACPCTGRINSDSCDRLRWLTPQPYAYV